MSVGKGSPWLPLLVTAGLLVSALPAVADRATVHVHDEDTLLVGEPTDQAGLHVGQAVLGQRVDAGTYKSYDLEVTPTDNRLEIDLRYDPGTITTGPCLKANDLDLFVQGPSFERSYPGCDSGEITVLADGVPTGNYTVRVEADHGSTACIPDELGSPCTSPGVEYSLEITVWARG